MVSLKLGEEGAEERQVLDKKDHKNSFGLNKVNNRSFSVGEWGKYLFFPPLSEGYHTFG